LGGYRDRERGFRGDDRHAVGMRSMLALSSYSTSTARPLHDGTDRQHVWKCVRGTGRDQHRGQSAANAPNLAKRQRPTYDIHMRAIQITVDERLLAALDADEEVRRLGRSAVLRRAAIEYLYECTSARSDDSDVPDSFTTGFRQLRVQLVEKFREFVVRRSPFRA
jgi:hypothetical protein